MGQKLKLLKTYGAEDKLAPQMKVILDQMAAVGVGKEIERESLIKSLEGNEKMVTRQPVSRILAYYMPHLKEGKFVELIKAEPAPKPEPKPAKDGGAAAATTKPEKAKAAA